MKRWQIAQIIAATATVLSVAGLALNELAGIEFGNTIMGIGVLLGLMSYLFGGLGTAISMAFEIAKVGLFIGPAPVNFFIFCVTGVLALMALVFVPIIPVRRAYNKYMGRG